MRKKSFLVLFCLLFCSFLPNSETLARTHQSLEDLKQQDIERSLKYERLKKNQVTSPINQILPGALPVDTDDDGMPDSWESANGLDPNDPDDAWFDPDNDKVVNLFEYQLGSDLNNPATPPVATVGPSGADYTDVETAIDSVTDGTAIRVAGGSYSVNYITFDPMTVMIQGGWSSDFSKRDLKLYPTTFDGGMLDEILYFSFSYSERAIILDGLQFVRGKGTIGVIVLLAQGGAFMKTSIFNCSIKESETGFGFCGVILMTNWDGSESDRTIANTLIVGNEASGIYSQNTEDAIAHWRIINTTISNNQNGGGDNGYGIDAFTLDYAVLTSHIYNSIIWGNEENDIEIWWNITFDVDHSDIGDVSAGGGAIYLPGAGVVNVDPLFVDLANDNIHLRDSSPLIDEGINQGIPLIDFEGDPRVTDGDNDNIAIVDMGADEYVFAADDLLGTWDGSGVWFRNSVTGSWVKMSPPAYLVAAGDLDGDGTDDLIGVWSSGLWVKYSSTGSWAKLSTSLPSNIASGDMDGDGRCDVLGSWSSGVYYKNMSSGTWVRMTTTPANHVAAGDLDGDMADDLIGVWPSGTWIRLSSLGRWMRIAIEADGVAAGDMNGNGSVDLLGSWSGLGVYYMDTQSMLWVKMSTSAQQVSAGDLDGDGTDDLIGVWSSGLWVKYSETGTWALITSILPRDMDAGKMTGGAGSVGVEGFMNLQAPIGGYAEGPESISNYQDLSSEGPGGWNFAFQEEENLVPQEKGFKIMMRMPGPGEAGFQYIEQKNLVPQNRLSEKKKKEKVN